MLIFLLNVLKYTDGRQQTELSNTLGRKVPFVAVNELSTDSDQNFVTIVS
jgi:hypothetical protein